MMHAGAPAGSHPAGCIIGGRSDVAGGIVRALRCRGAGRCCPLARSAGEGRRRQARGPGAAARGTAYRQDWVRVVSPEVMQEVPTFVQDVAYVPETPQAGTSVVQPSVWTHFRREYVQENSVVYRWVSASSQL